MNLKKTGVTSAVFFQSTYNEVDGCSRALLISLLERWVMR